MVDFAGLLRELRQNVGMTQKELADRLWILTPGLPDEDVAFLDGAVKFLRKKSLVKNGKAKLPCMIERERCYGI